MSQAKVILVVDDTNIVRQGTALTLQHFFGFKTDEAANGFSALEMLKTSSYAVILMDCDMPEMDGFQCTRQIRELEKLTDRRTPIIGMTASSARDIRGSCLKAGMDDYLDKSCSNEELRAILFKWVEI